MIYERLGSSGRTATVYRSNYNEGVPGVTYRVEMFGKPPARYCLIQHGRIGQLIAIGGLAFAIAVSVGCNRSDRCSVSGTLLHADGTPLVGARVIARSGDGKYAYGMTDSVGLFKLGIDKPGDGVPPGEYQLSISEDRGDADNRRRPTIAEKYENAKTSGLSINAEAGGSENREFKLDSR